MARTHVDSVLLAAKWNSDSVQRVADTIDWMKRQHIAVILVGPTLVYDAPVPRLVIAAMRVSDMTLLKRHVAYAEIELDSRMAELAEMHGISYISLVLVVWLDALG
jgi:hypothetical protein